MRTLGVFIFSVLAHGLLLYPYSGFKPRSYHIPQSARIIPATLVMSSVTPVRPQPHSEKKVLQDVKKGQGLPVKKRPTTNEWPQHLSRRLTPAKTKSLNGEQINQLVTLIHQAVNRHKVYPIRARRLRHKGRVVVGFDLLPSGRVARLKLVTSSHHQELDQAALNSVLKAQPFAGVSALLRSKQSVAIPIIYK